jgi:hypothetical protein
VNTGPGPIERRLEQVQSSASRAMRSANGKNKVFHQASAPTTAVGLTAGDIWFDTSNDNRINTWTGSAWSAFQLGEDAIENLSITNAKIKDATIEYGKIASLDMGTASTGKLKAQYIDVTNLFAQNISATGNFSVHNSRYTLEANNQGLTIGSDNNNALVYGQQVTISAENGSCSIYGDLITIGDEDSKTVISGFLLLEEKTTSVSVNANSSVGGSINVAKDGYTPIGVVGYRITSTSASYMILSQSYISGSYYHWHVRNTSGTNVSGTDNFVITVLYMAS